MQIPSLTFSLPEGKKVFFVSDFHLGAPNKEESRKREKEIVRWIDEHRAQMAALFLLGDIFDYWFEYRFVVPKGFVRLMAKLAQLADEGVAVHFFGGNHDLWNTSYFQEELGMVVHRGNLELHINEARFFVGHGDGLSTHEGGYRLMKSVFESKIVRVFYAALHPFWAGHIARLMSRHSRHSGLATDKAQHIAHEHEKNQRLLPFMQQMRKQKPIDFFVFAHRHWPVLAELSETDSQVRVLPEHRVRLNRAAQAGQRPAYYLNTGDWLHYHTYASFDGEVLELEGKHIQDSF